MGLGIRKGSKSSIFKQLWNQDQNQTGQRMSPPHMLSIALTRWAKEKINIIYMTVLCKTIYNLIKWHIGYYIAHTKYYTLCVIHYVLQYRNPAKDCDMRGSQMAISGPSVFIQKIDQTKLEVKAFIFSTITEQQKCHVSMISPSEWTHIIHGLNVLNWSERYKYNKIC